MDLNRILIWVVAVSTLLTAYQHWRRYGLRSWGTLTLCAAILAAIGLAMVYSPGRAGPVGLLLWGTFLLVPSLGSQWVNRLVAQRRYPLARRLARVMAVLHPLDGWWEMPTLVTVLELLQQGQREKAQQLMAGMRNAESSMGYFARLQLFRLDWRWQQLRDWVEQHPRPQQILRDVMAGLPAGRECLVEVDRAAAIAAAVAEAGPEDLVLIAGKGHEDYQILGTERIHFDDREEAEKSLNSRLHR